MRLEVIPETILDVTRSNRRHHSKNDTVQDSNTKTKSKEKCDNSTRQTDTTKSWAVGMRFI